MMRLRLVELPVERVRVDEDRFPSRPKGWVTEHLVHYLSHSETLPAIDIVVDSLGPVVTEGHGYLAAAVALGRSRIRAIVDPSSDADAVDGLIGRSDVEILSWLEIEARERAEPVIDQWHVFYFERSLSETEKDRFDREIAGFFTDVPPQVGTDGEPPVVDVHHDDRERRAEFKVRVLPGDERWYGRYLAAIGKFDSDTVRIASFQGRVFDGEGESGHNP